MTQMEDRIGAILNNPQMMQQIMSMAQSLNQGNRQNTPEDPPPPQEKPPQVPDFDPGMVQKLSGFARQSNIDPQQRALLKALAPYLSRQRISKLEKAMRAAKMARFASGFLNSGVLQTLTGR